MNQRRRTVAFGCLIALLLLSLTPGATETARIKHRWGETLFSGQANRIVSLSFTGIDTLLALGLQPLAYRAWYGGDKNGLWPWTAAKLPAGADFTVLRGEIDIERVARLQPDFVEAMYSGLSRAQYAALSRLAPVLPASEGKGDFGATWDDMLLAVGEATGRHALARDRIAKINAHLASIRVAHPDWQGKTAVVALPHGPLIFGAIDPRMALLMQLGFRLPDAAQRLSLGGFYFQLDHELTEPIDADVILWLDLGGGTDHLAKYPLRHTLRAVREGREVIAPPALSAALSYASPLSIPYALELLVPMLEAALDGDPATAVPGASEAERL